MNISVGKMSSEIVEVGLGVRGLEVEKIEEKR